VRQKSLSPFSRGASGAPLLHRLRSGAIHPYQHRQLAPKYTVHQFARAGSAYCSFVKSDILASFFKCGDVCGLGLSMTFPQSVSTPSQLHKFLDWICGWHSARRQGPETHIQLIESIEWRAVGRCSFKGRGEMFRVPAPGRCCRCWDVGTESTRVTCVEASADPLDIRADPEPASAGRVHSISAAESSYTSPGDALDVPRVDDHAHRRGSCQGP
jgi:hypothetical protein